MLSEKEIAEITERLLGITPGKWATEQPCGFPYTGIYIVSHTANDKKNFHHFISEIRQLREHDESLANAELIAHAPTDIAALLADNAEKDAEIDRIKKLSEVANALTQIALAEKDKVIEGLKAKLDEALKLANQQAEDWSLWFVATNITEEHLQLALRKLHAVLEGDKLMVNILEVQPKTGESDPTEAKP